MNGDGSEAVVIGIDAGGTRTRGVAVDANGTVVARTQAGGANPRTLGDAHGREQIRGVVDVLRGIGRRPVAHLMLGTAGLLDPAAAPVCRAWAALLDVASVSVDSDVRIAHAAAFGSEPGLMLVAGTGSQCLAIDPAGARTSVGGWGPTFGDEGSGYWIASNAIRAALQALDGGRPTPLSRALLAYADVPPEAKTRERNGRLLDVLYEPHGGAAAHARFAHMVTEVAQDGDAEAKALLQRAGRLLADMASLAARRSGVRRVACAGGVLEHSGFVAESLDAGLVEHRLECVPGPSEPVFGAAYLAMVAAGWDARAVRVARSTGDDTSHTVGR